MTHRHPIFRTAAARGPRHVANRAFLLAAMLATASSALAGEDPHVFGDGFEEPPAGACDDPMIEPEGFIIQTFTWVENWSAPDNDPLAVYPSSVGFPVPVGAPKRTLRVVPFVPAANETINISWNPVQANPQQGYFPPRPADGAWFSLSPCAGDARPSDDLSADPFLRSGCRRGGASNGLIFTTLAGESNHQVCHLVAGTTYYMTILMANPQDGLTLEETTCSDVPASDARCDVQATHRPQ